MEMRRSGPRRRRQAYGGTGAPAPGTTAGPGPTEAGYGAATQPQSTGPAAGTIGAGGTTAAGGVPTNGPEPVTTPGSGGPGGATTPANVANLGTTASLFLTTGGQPGGNTGGENKCGTFTAINCNKI